MAATKAAPKPKSKQGAYPKNMESAASLWLEFFTQFCELTLQVDDAMPEFQGNKDAEAMDRARTLADRALETFQDRFPGVHP